MKLNLTNLKNDYKSLLDQDIGTQERIFENLRNKDIQKMYSEPKTQRYYHYKEVNSPLQKGQLRLMREMTAIRHQIHTNNPDIFFETKLKKKIDKYFLLASTLEYFRKENLPFPYEVLKKYERLETISQMKENGLTPEETVKLFAVEVEEVNKAFERWIIKIDEMYGCNYKVTGVLRKKDIEAEKVHEEHIKKVAINKGYAENYFGSIGD